MPDNHQLNITYSKNYNQLGVLIFMLVVWCIGESFILNSIFDTSWEQLNNISGYITISWYIIFSFYGLLVLIPVLRILFGKEIFTCHRTKLYYKYYFAGIMLYSKKYIIANIKLLRYAPEKIGNDGGLSLFTYKIHFEYNGKTQKFGFQIPDKQAYTVINELKKYYTEYNLAK